MATPTSVSPSTSLPGATVDATRVYQEGIVGGLLGGLAVAAWFLVVDLVHGRPLYTPTVLGQALFGRGVWPATLDSLSPSLEMTAMFTWVHLMVFAVLGVVVARLIVTAEQHPSLGFGFVLLFVILEACFTAAAMIVAAPVLRALTWPNILVANLLAAAAMAGYFWLRHRTLTMRP